MQDYKAKLEPENYYHIYNRANGSEKLFLNDDNYLYFLQKYNFYISPIADTFAYCLMPNHFHFLVRIKALPPVTFQKFKTFEKFASKQFSNLFSSYTQAYNKQNNRMGSLFIPRFNRKHINSTEYLKNTLNYIHQNPVAHGYAKELDEWKFSSYSSFFNNKATKINKQEAIEWFYDLENFKAYHNIKKAEHLALEMDINY